MKAIVVLGLTVLCLLFAVYRFGQTLVVEGPVGKMKPYSSPPSVYPEPYESPPMELIPEGEYEMGDHSGTGFGDDLPVHAVYIDAFYMDTFEVTNEEYCTYLNSAYSQRLIEVLGAVVYKKGDTEPYCNTNQSWTRITWNGSTFGVVADKEDHPMVMVSWYGAVAYTNWRSEQMGLTPCYDLETWECTFGAAGYRLPTEAEWEKAARGGEHDPYYVYPWGNTLKGSNANFWMSGDPYELEPEPWTTPVGYYDGNQIPPGGDMANGYGLYDMTGNVFEWCNEWYHHDYYQYCVDHGIYYNPEGPSTSTNGCRVTRGGSWAYYGELLDLYLTCSFRSNYYDSPDGYKPDGRYTSVGFRVVQE